jgi:hypothetical protein
MSPPRHLATSPPQPLPFALTWARSRRISPHVRRQASSWLEADSTISESLLSAMLANGASAHRVSTSRNLEAARSVW